MPGRFFSILIDNELVTFEKNRVIAIEPAFNGTKIIIEASHTAEEPIVYVTTETYENVIKSYSS